MAGDGVLMVRSITMQPGGDQYIPAGAAHKAKRGRKVYKNAEAANADRLVKVPPDRMECRLSKAGKREGHPKIVPTERDYAQIELLSSYGCSVDEIARVLGWSRASWTRVKRDEVERYGEDDAPLVQARRRGIAHLHVELRKAALHAATKRYNAKVLVFLLESVLQMEKPGDARKYQKKMDNAFSTLNMEKLEAKVVEVLGERFRNRLVDPEARELLTTGESGQVTPVVTGNEGLPTPHGKEEPEIDENDENVPDGA